jgi:tryptophan-rich sensory protein
MAVSPRVKSAITLGVFTGFAFLIGGVGGTATRSALESWYPTLEKSALNPPNAAFPIAWTILFLFMGIAAWLVWREGYREPETVKRGLRLYFIQLIFNLTWSVVFFGMQSPLGGLVVIVPFWLLIIHMALEYRKVSEPAFWLTVPYILWVGFAGYLNFMVFILN